MSGLTTYVKKAQSYAQDQIVAFSDKIVYHDIKFAQRYAEFVVNIGTDVELDQEVVDLATIGAWMISASYGEEQLSKGDTAFPVSNLQEISRKKLTEFAAHVELPAENLAELETAFDTSFLPAEPQTDIARLLIDAAVAEILIEDGYKHTKKLYQEMILKDAPISKVKWFDAVAGIVESFTFSFPYCEEKMLPQKEKLLKSLLKEKKALNKRSDLVLKRELDVSERELKDLKKDLEKSKGRDDRGIQTLFRTTSKNHYTLNTMIDRKANIMITVNSIILSLVLGGVVSGNDTAEMNVLLFPVSSSTFNILLLPVVLLTLTSVSSVVFAILSIRPDVTHGSFTEEEVRNKGGNLLFYGNFHNMHERDFEWGFLQMMNDREYMYSSMIKDIYHLGQTLNKKYRNLRVSLTIFMFGLVLSVFAFWLTNFMA